MQTNQLYLQKTGDNGFVEETETLISASGGNVGIGTHIPASNAKLEVVGNICLTGGRLGVKTLQPQSAAEIYGTLSLNTSGQTRGLWFGSGIQALGYIGASDYAINGLSTVDFGISSATDELDLTGCVAFGIGGAEKMRIDTFGNVGIGTTNPSKKLELQADAGSNTYPFFVKGSNTDKNRIGGIFDIHHGTSSIGVLTAFRNDSETEVFLTASGDSYLLGGNVGIGTSSPAGKLSLPTSGGANASDGIMLGNSANTHGLNIWSDQSGQTVNYFDSVYDSAHSLVQFRTRTAGTAVNALTISGNGNVGIGTSTPASLLELAGTTNPELRITDTAPGSAAAATFRAENSSATLGSYSDHPLYLVANNSTKMTLLSDGNVGIGTTTPEQALDVDGRARADQFGFRDDAANPNYYFDNFGGSNFLGKDGSPVVLYSNGTATMAWDDGKVGIGTTAPVSALELQGANTIDSRLTFLQTTTSKSGTLQQGSQGLGISALGSDNDIFLSTNGATHLTVTSGGNVGIGTTNPTHALTIGDGTESTWIKLDGADGAFEMGAASITGPEKYFSIYDTEAVQHRFVISEAGYVGIGTTSPIAKLSLPTTGVGASAADGITLGNSANTHGLNIWSDQSGHTVNYFDSVYDGADSLVQFRTRTAGTAVNALTISGNGNVGIGTTTPGHKLVVKATTSTNDGIYLTDENDNNRALLYTAGVGEGSFQLISNSNTPGVVFSTDTNDNYISNGNVGIGTSTPSAKLEIAGAGEGIVLQSPDGTKYLVTVANGGAVTTSAV